MVMEAIWLSIQVLVLFFLIKHQASDRRVFPRHGYMLQGELLSLSFPVSQNQFFRKLFLKPKH